MGELVWDDRLISRAHAFELVARWPVVLVHHPGEGSIHVHCAAPPHGGGRKGCYQSCGRVLADYRVTLEELVAGLLRHAVNAHDLDTGTRGRDVRRPAEGPRDGGGGARRRRGGGAPHRPRDQTAGAPRGEGAPGGDPA